MLGDVVLREWKNSITDGLVGVGGTSSSSGIREKGTSMRLEPNSRMTLIMPEGAVAACTSHVRPRCESSTFCVVQSGFTRSIRRIVVSKTFSASLARSSPIRSTGRTK